MQQYYPLSYQLDDTYNDITHAIYLGSQLVDTCWTSPSYSLFLYPDQSLQQRYRDPIIFIFDVALHTTTRANW